MPDFSPLPTQRLAGTISVARPAAPKSTSLSSPATEVMTDLTYIHAAVITPSSSMESANAYMIQRGVRLLLVLNPNRSLAGLITSTDILGEKPLRFIQERRVRHDEVLVSDIMTPLDKLDAILLDEVTGTKVGHVIASLRDSGRQHTLVVERDAGGQTTVRGIFSRSQIERQLGMQIQSTGLAHSFAEIEARLAEN